LTEINVEVVVSSTIKLERIGIRRSERRFSMATNNRQHEGQVGGADWAFVAFLVLITAIAATLTLLQIYLQNPQ